MSSIPPNFNIPSSSQDPSSTDNNNQPPPSAGKQSTNKEFKLAKQSQQTKSTFSSSKQEVIKKKTKENPSQQGNENIVQDSKQDVSSLGEKENAQVGKMEGTQKVADIKVLHAVILKNVDSIRIGKGVVEVDLKGNAELPKVFQGSQLSLSQTDQGLVIKIDNVSNVSEAQKLLNSDASAMQLLANQLAAKGFAQAQFQVGNVTIALPPPVKATVEVASAGQQSFEREGGGQQGGGGGQQQQGDQKGRR